MTAPSSQPEESRPTLLPEESRPTLLPFGRIDLLVSKENFCFQSWDDRYGKGIWVALGSYPLQIDTFRDLSDDGDSEWYAFPAVDYIRSADWLPYATGETLSQAMQRLEERLAALPEEQLQRESRWSRLVYDALLALHEATCPRSRSPGILKNLPRTFELALKHGCPMPSFPDEND